MPVSLNARLVARLRLWRQIRALRGPVQALPGIVKPPRATARVVIVPCDPWTLVGSKGDEAMILSVVQQLHRADAGVTVAVVTASPLAQEVALALGLLPLPAWECSMSRAIELLTEFDADAMVVVGADVMDGYYAPHTTARMLMMAQAGARCGMRVSILGFSFNANPNPGLRPVFDDLDAAVMLNVRDPRSRQRLAQFSHRQSRLVADAAFLLEPDPGGAEVQAVAAWATARRGRGELVLGFNMHPMLVKNASPQQIASYIDSAVTALGRLCERRSVAVLLIPHDYRGRDGDDVCLGPIARALEPRLGARLMYPTHQFAAAELKAIAGGVDGIVAGRMHLVIAGLGMERPVAALTYQDKFQGLFAHFDYPERFLLTPGDAGDPEQLARLLEEFLDHLPELAGRVRRALPAVKRLSALNLELILEELSAAGDARTMAAAA